MGIFQNVKAEIEGHFNKRNAERARFDEIRRDTDFQKRQLFEDQFKKNALLANRDQALKEARLGSGINKLRGINRANALENQGETSGTFFGKLADYTQANLSRREDNIKKTEQLREAARKMREDKQSERISLREQRMANNQTRRTMRGAI